MNLCRWSMHQERQDWPLFSGSWENICTGGNPLGNCHVTLRVRLLIWERFGPLEPPALDRFGDLVWCGLLHCECRGKESLLHHAAWHILAYFGIFWHILACLPYISMFQHVPTCSSNMFQHVPSVLSVVDERRKAQFQPGLIDHGPGLWWDWQVSKHRHLSGSDAMRDFSGIQKSEVQPHPGGNMWQLFKSS